SKRGFQRGWRAACWAASDPDGDELTFEVRIHPVGDALWTPLARAIPETYSTWDETALPDGRYELEIVASDEADNGAGKGLEGRRVSQPFDVDTTPPRVEELSAKAGKSGLEVSFVAVDAGVGVGGAALQVDAGPLVPLVPVDGIADSGRERYSSTLPAV